MESHGLNDIETLRATALEISLGLFAVESLKKIPGGIAKPEKWPAILVLKEVTVARNDNRAKIIGRFGSDRRRVCHSKNNEDNQQDR